MKKNFSDIADKYDIQYFDVRVSPGITGQEYYAKWHYKNTPFREAMRFMSPETDNNSTIFYNRLLEVMDYYKIPMRFSVYLNQIEDDAKNLA